MRTFVRKTRKIWQRLSLRAKATSILLLLAVFVTSLAVYSIHRSQGTTGFSLVLLLIAALADLMAVLEVLFIELIEPETQRRFFKRVTRYLLADPSRRASLFAGIFALAIVSALVSYVLVANQPFGIDEVRLIEHFSVDLRRYKYMQTALGIVVIGVCVFLFSKVVLKKGFFRRIPLTSSQLQDIFVGRESELKLFKDLLYSLGSAPYALCVHGLPGVGKSELLRQFRKVANKCGIRVLPKRSFSEVVGAHSLTLFLKEILDVPVNPEAARTDPTFTILRGVLDELAAAPSVLIIDTTKDFKDLTGLAETLLFLTKAMQADKVKGIIVVATRDQVPVNSTAPVDHLHLDGFKREAEVIELISLRQWDPKLLDHAHSLLTRTGGNPQVIEWICGTPRLSDWFIQHRGDVRVDSVPDVRALLDGLWSEMSAGERQAICTLSVATSLSPKCDNNLCMYLVSFWAEVVDGLCGKGCVTRSEVDDAYGIHDLLQDYVYDKASSKQSTHDRLGGYFLAGKNDSGKILALHHYAIAENIEGAAKAYSPATDALKLAGDYRRLKMIVVQLLGHVEPDIPFRVQLLKDQGFALLMLARPVEALEVYQTARGVPTTVTEQDKADILWGIAESCRLRDIYADAIQSYQEAEELYQRAHNHRGVIEALWGAAESARMLGHHHQAAELFEKAATMSEQIGSDLGQARALTGLGSSYRRLHQYSRAMTNYEKALHIAERIRNDYERAWILRCMGQLYRMIHQFDRAFERFHQVCDVFYQVGNDLGVTWAAIGCGDSLRMLGRHDEALSYYQTALDLSHRTGDRSGEATALLGMAEIARVSGNAIKSIDWAKMAEEVLAGTGRDEEIANCRLSIAETHRLNDDPILKEYDMILESYEKVDARWGMIHTLIGKALAQIEDWEVAGHLIRRAREMAEWSSLEPELELIAKIESERRKDEVHLLNFP